MPRLRLAVCHLCRRGMPAEQTGWSEVTRLRYCRPAEPGEFDRCLFIACLRLHVPRAIAEEAASRPIFEGLRAVLIALYRLGGRVSAP